MGLRRLAVLAAIGACVAVACATQKPEAVAPKPTPNNTPLAAYAVVALSTEPVAALYLKAVDPLTGADLPGRPPIELGHDGAEALSPDGATIALGWAPKDSGGYGPQRLSLLDTARWEKRDAAFQDGIARLFWSPDGSRIYAETFHCFVCSKLQPRLITLDAVTGNVEAEVELPFETYQSFLAPDGATLYLVGREDFNPQVVAQPPPPRLVAFDTQAGKVRAELELPDLLYGPQKETAASGDYYAQYLPGIAMSPDGQRLYIGHPDRDRIDVVDLRAMRLERSAEVRRPSSLIERFFSLFAVKAEAKVQATNSALLSISADGRRLYYARHGEHPPFDANGQPQSTDTGLRVVDAGSFNVMSELDPAEQFHGVRFASEIFLSEASDQYVFVLRGLQLVVLDSHDPHEVSSGTIGSVYNLLLGPKPPADR